MFLRVKVFLKLNQIFVLHVDLDTGYHHANIREFHRELFGFSWLCLVGFLVSLLCCAF